MPSQSGALKRHYIKSRNIYPLQRSRIIQHWQQYIVATREENKCMEWSM